MPNAIPAEVEEARAASLNPTVTEGVRVQRNPSPSFAGSPSVEERTPRSRWRSRPSPRRARPERLAVCCRNVCSATRGEDAGAFAAETLPSWRFATGLRARAGRGRFASPTTGSMPAAARLRDGSGRPARGRARYQPPQTGSPRPPHLPRPSLASAARIEPQARTSWCATVARSRARSPNSRCRRNGWRRRRDRTAPLS